MTNAKYKIMLRIYQSTVTKPVCRRDFYVKARHINQNKKTIDELVKLGWIKQDSGSDRLLITNDGISSLEADIERREDIRRISVQFWVSSFLSLAALAVSIIALLIQAAQQ